MKIDIWYPGEVAVFATCTFSDCDCIYRGTLFNAEGKMIGDYSSTDSVEIERRFPGIFGN